MKRVVALEKRLDKLEGTPSTQYLDPEKWTAVLEGLVELERQLGLVTEGRHTIGHLANLQEHQEGQQARGDIVSRILPQFLVELRIAMGVRTQ